MRRFLLAAALAAPLAASAQDSLPPLRPFRGGLQVTIAPFAYASFASNGLTGGEERNGIGFGGTAGYGFTQRFALVVDLTVTDAVLDPGSSYNLYHVDFLARPALKPFVVAGSEVVLFLDAGGGLVRLSGKRPAGPSVEDHSWSGSFITLGVGTSIFVRRHFAITATAHGTLGTFSDQKIGNVTQSNYSIFARSVRTAVGVSWHPQRP